MNEINTREKYVRVTNVLYPFSGLDKINVDTVAHAAERGTKVHQICEAIAAGLGEHIDDKEMVGYVDSFKKWWEIGHSVIEMEKRFWCNDLKVTGQVDFIIDTPDGLAVVDLKTSYKPSKTWSVQGAAYAYLAKKNLYDIKKIYFIHLSKQGKFPKIYEYPVDDSFFLAVYRTYMHFYHKETE